MKVNRNKKWDKTKYICIEDAWNCIEVQVPMKYVFSISENEIVFDRKFLKVIDRYSIIKDNCLKTVGKDREWLIKFFMKKTLGTCDTYESNYLGACNAYELNYMNEKHWLGTIFIDFSYDELQVIEKGNKIIYKFPKF